MKREVKKLTLEQAEDIYYRFLVNHFPEGEVKPFESISRMWKINGYEGYGLYEGSEMLAYAFIANVPDGQESLLDYFAVIGDKRNQGIGGDFLQKISSNMKDKKVLIIETEAVEFAENEDEKNQRLRRDAFYLRNHVSKTKWIGHVYGVVYRVWYIPCDENVTEEDCGSYYDRIYRHMLQEERYSKYFRLVESKE